MSEKFDSDAFLEWLDDQDGSVRADVLRDEWPNFPWHNVPVAVTVGLDDDGESLWYQRDLRRAVKGLPNLD